MEDLTFGEQVKIILSRKNMTIKQLAEIIEEQTGKAMSRQNLTQRLGRDNFQEQDMRMIAEILGCPFHLSIFPTKEIEEVEEPELIEEEAEEVVEEPEMIEEEAEEVAEEPEMIKEEVEAVIEEPEMIEEEAEEVIEEPEMIEAEIEEVAKEPEVVLEETPVSAPVENPKPKEKKGGLFRSGTIFLRKNGVEMTESSQPVREEPAKEAPVRKEPIKVEKKREPITPDSSDFEPVVKHHDMKEDLEVGEVNPYTGHEYLSNSVRMHPSRIGYVQVYDREKHSWTDMTEWAFLGYQEQKKAELGKDYQQPIYLD